jgi:signal transduction histidine kinase
MAPFPTVLVVSDDPRFSPTLIACWQKEGNAPDFVCMSGEVRAGEATSAYTLAIIGPMHQARAAAAIDRLSRASRPLIVVSREPEMLQSARSAPPAPLCIHQQGDWARKVVEYGTSLLGGNAPPRALRADLPDADRELLLGRCVIEMRHELSNALTSILGNAELMMLAEASLPPRSREQAAAIHEMALRVHDLFRDMASRENELQLSGSLGPLETSSQEL